MRTLISLSLVGLLGGCSLLQPQPLPAPEPIIKTVTEYKTLEIYQPPLPKAINKSLVHTLHAMPLVALT